MGPVAVLEMVDDLAYFLIEWIDVDEVDAGVIAKALVTRGWVAAWPSEEKE